MSYTFQGFIGSPESLKTAGVRLRQAKVVALSGGLAVLPLDKDLQKEINAGAEPLREGWDSLTGRIEAFGRNLSKKTKSRIVYAEADYFGGWGDQSSVVWENGEELLHAVRADKAINQALRLLGVQCAEEEVDEFDTVGLGRHRRIEGWLTDENHALGVLRTIDVRNHPGRTDEAAAYIGGQWGSESNQSFYRDCIERSCDTDSDLPRFFLLTNEEDESVVGSYALLRSDLNSRQDLSPWLACLYIEPDWRSRGLGAELLEHAIHEVRTQGYRSLYLCTDLDGYYERYNWIHIGRGYEIDGAETRIYEYRIEPQRDEREPD